MMNSYFNSRTFQFWEFRVSHGSLLVRSPQTESKGWATNIDIAFTGVEYVALPRFLRGIEILEAQPEDLRELEIILAKQILPSSVHILASLGQRFRIVAASIKIEENQKDTFESPFE